MNHGSLSLGGTVQTKAPDFFCVRHCCLAGAARPYSWQSSTPRARSPGGPGAPRSSAGALQRAVTSGPEYIVPDDPGR
jgi:hypothetical protein